MATISEIPESSTDESEPLFSWEDRYYLRRDQLVTLEEFGKNLEFWRDQGFSPEDALTITWNVFENQEARDGEAFITWVALRHLSRL